MQITVRLFAWFRVGRFSEATQQYPAGTKIADIITGLGLALKDIGMIMVDGVHAEADDPIHEGARLALFPLVGGG